MNEDDDAPLEDLCDKPLEVATYREAVVLKGPDGVCLALTIEAAEASVERLRYAIDQAKASPRPKRSG